MLSCKNVGITISELDMMNICDALDIVYTYINQMDEIRNNDINEKIDKAKQENFNIF